jgi:uncharacterized protein
VDWYPWGEEAFEKARTENKPIFLSVGYSTCHWCHVMERESFENVGTAQILNRDFVAIKVDREERPDIDRIYMSYVQAATGSGGWPMSVWLTPRLQPFIGGTYYPPENKYGRAGFPLMLERIAKAWREERERIVESSASVVEQLRDQADARPAGEPEPDALERGFAHFQRTFDSRLGGFGGAPKFPRPVVLNFLLRYYARTKNEDALDMVLETLRAMAKGGMHDQLGGGFHRYSVDEYWFVPHFEKMLYDQAQLATSYLEAYQITHDEYFANVARRTLDYVLRDMTDAGGGFYSAEDADSVIDPAHPHEKGEGAFYVWTLQEIEDLVGQPAARYFSYRYGVEAHGNVRNDPHSEFTGKNILFEAQTLEETNHHFDSDVQSSIAATSAKLLQERGKRIRPHLDDKILTAWNGLMISAFAKAGMVLGDEKYAKAAQRAKDFISTKMYRNGVLLRSDRPIAGFLDDYAFFTQALIDLGETDLAVQLTEKQCELFEDVERGGFFSTALGDPTLILRMKEDYDGAEPSGNSVAVLNLLRLARMTGREDFERSARRALEAFAGRINQAPSAAPQLLAAYEFGTNPPKQVVLAEGQDKAGLEAMEHAFYAKFLPSFVLLKGKQGMPAINGKATAYVCENFACQLPITDVDQFSALLQ